jgi:hypothetical protein
MGTPGLVSVKRGDKVVMKVIAGCNGQHAQKVANELLNSWPVGEYTAYKIAKDLGFGCINDLIVMTEKNIVSPRDELSPHFRETFKEPDSNPVWREGMEFFTIIIDI